MSDQPAFNTLDALRAAWDAHSSRGWASVAIAPGAKAPRTPGWQESDGGDAFRSQLESGGNIGVLLGDPSGRLVDVDLDSADALLFAPHFLPSTPLRSGRTGRPESHWWYVAESKAKALPRTIRLRARFDSSQQGGGATIVELRSNGAQTVTAPSVVFGAEPGDVRRYEWVDFTAEPASVKWRQLEARVRELAACCVLRHAWVAGGVHDLVLAVAGTLAKAGKPMDDALAFLARCGAAIPREDSAGGWDLAAIRQKVESTYAAHSAGTDVRGFRGLADCLGEPLAEDLCRILGIRNALAADTDASLPTITHGSRELRDTADAALDAMREANEPRWLFVQGGALVRVVTVPTDDGTPRPEVQQLDLYGLRSAMTASANWRTLRGNGQPAVCPPPLDVVHEVQARRDLAGFPVLVGITRTPFLRPDGTVCSEPGYDAATGMLYVPSDGLRLPPLPPEPTDEDVSKAQAFIAESLSEFPFDSEASRANAWAFLATVVLRSALRDPVPLFGFTSPQEGTGKTEGANLAGYIVDGERPSSMTAPKNPEEWDKSVLSALRTGPRLVVVDNVAQVLKSDTLDSLATKTEHEGRDLGHTRWIRVPARAVWAFTGNNLRLGGDLRRRFVLVGMDTGLERPWERQFRRDLEKWCAAHRGDLLWSWLVLARRWHVLGKPEPEGVPTLAGYGDWRRLVGGVLQVAGIPGMLGNAEQVVTELDEERAGVRALFLAWWQAFGDQPVTARTLAEKLVATAPDALEEAGVEGDPLQQARRLGYVLRTRRGQVHGGLRLELARDPRNKRLTREWRLGLVRPGMLDERRGSGAENRSDGAL